jgi:hypothetical protein
MKTLMKASVRIALGTTILGSGAILAIAPAAAQNTIASVGGHVTTAEGAASAGATVTAVNTGTNQTFRTVTDTAGGYVLNGLRPGPYKVTVTGTDGSTRDQYVTVAIGQSATLDVTLGGEAPVTTADADTGDIIITGSTLREVKTSEVATNVSRTQIETLPQTDRNFLSFAALAPGVRYNDSETDKGIQSGAATASQVNVFIDGVSLKNKLREGGVAGQQNSRGNPFGQSAVQEFRVLTQNYKAEYEQAGAAIVTAVTKSGTNNFSGEIFGQYTNRSLSSTSYIDKKNNQPKPPFTRKQYGASLGGPIITDKLFFFLDYEGNDQDRSKNVIPGGTPDSRAEFERLSGHKLSEFQGSFLSPFRGDFYFGKLTFTPDSRQVFDLSYSKRQETDIQGFGDGNTAYSAAENKRNSVDTYLFKWTYTGDSFVNEFSASHLNYRFNPVSLNPNLATFEYVPVIVFGGKDSTRDEIQKDYTIRDDFTFSGISHHVIKVGARIDVTDISFADTNFAQPHYIFDNDNNAGLDYSFPSRAMLGLGNARITASDSQIGLYAQDDWDITSKLQLNLGVRWDYETNGFNNNYVTPSNAAAALRLIPANSYFNPENYISTGSNRKPFAGAIAPRFGFSYDLSGNKSTVIFGGFGRYYDRNNFNNTIDEISRRLNPTGTFFFSKDGLPRQGQNTVVWNDSYLTREGLLALAASSTQGLPQLFAVKNNAKPPVNDQFSLGIRQKFGHWEASLTGSYIRGRNGYTNLWGTRQNNGLGNCCDNDLLNRISALGYSQVLIGYDGLDTRYKALYFTLDKNYTKASGWGFNLAYTLSKGEQNGGDLFSLDGVTPDAYGWRPRTGDERHRIVLSGIVDLPLGFQFSTLSTFGSGQAYQVFDATNQNTTGARLTAAYPEKNCIKGLFAFCEVNVTLEKHIKVGVFGKDQFALALDVLNVFNNKNFSGFDGFLNNNQTPPDPLDPADAAHANTILTLPRRIQFRASYKF